MLIVFCCDPLEPRSVDRSFGEEAEAVDRLGIPHVLIDHDSLVRYDEPGRAVRRVPEQPEPVLAAYRGWMVTPPRYQGLSEALAARNVCLINDLEQYRHGHHLPENYPVIEGRTPRTAWLSGDLGIDRVMEALATFGEAPVVVKDFVKSRKHEWAEACFIPSAADRGAAERVIRRFLELQGADLAGGLVFREFVEFEPVGVHPRSGMPLTEGVSHLLARRLPRLLVALLGQRKLPDLSAADRGVLRGRRRGKKPLLHDGPSEAA